MFRYDCDHGHFQLIFSGLVGNGNLVLYLTTTHVLEKFEERLLFGYPPDCGPDCDEVFC